MNIPRTGPSRHVKKDMIYVCNARLMKKERKQHFFAVGLVRKLGKNTFDVFTTTKTASK